MIEISTKDASLDLQNDAKITIKQKSSLFTILEKEDKQSHSYPFNLPLSSNNNRIISNILEQKKEETLQTVVRKNGVRLFKADLRITERTNENYEVALQLNKKTDLFNRKMNTLFLQLGTFFITDSNRYVDLLFHIFSFIGEPDWSSYTATVEVIVSGQKYIVTDTLDQIVFTLANVINADTANNNATAIASNTDFNNFIRIEEVNTSLPFFAYSQNWNTRFGNNVAYGAVGLIPLPKNETTNKNIAVTHANTIDSLANFRDAPYCFPYFLATKMHINPNDATSYQKYSDFSVILPSIRITALIEKILSVANWKLDSNFLKEEEIEKLFILNCYGIARQKPNEQLDVKQFLQFFWADCLPNISFVEFLDELRKMFCLHIDFNHTNKTLYIEPSVQKINQKFPLQYECTEFFSEKTKEKNLGYILKYDVKEQTKEEENELDNSLLAEKIIKNGDTEIISNFPFLPAFTFNYDSDLNGIGLYLEGLTVPASVAAFGYHRGYELFINRKFVLKEGVVKSINFMSYEGDKRSKIDTQNYSLTWESLYNTFYKKYLSLLDNSEVEREIIFKFSDLQEIDLTELIRLEYSNYYIKELEYTLTNNEQIRILAKVNLIKTL